MNLDSHRSDEKQIWSPGLADGQMREQLLANGAKRRLSFEEQTSSKRIKKEERKATEKELKLWAVKTNRGDMPDFLEQVDVKKAKLEKIKDTIVVNLQGNIEYSSELYKKHEWEFDEDDKKEIATYIYLVKRVEYDLVSDEFPDLYKRYGNGRTMYRVIKKKYKKLFGTRQPKKPAPSAGTHPAINAVADFHVPQARGGCVPSPYVNNQEFDGSYKNQGGGCVSSPYVNNQGGGCVPSFSLKNQGGGCVPSPYVNNQEFDGSYKNQGGGCVPSPYVNNQGGGCVPTFSLKNQGGGCVPSPYVNNQGGGCVSSPSLNNQTFDGSFKIPEGWVVHETLLSVLKEELVSETGRGVMPSKKEGYCTPPRTTKRHPDMTPAEDLAYGRESAQRCRDKKKANLEYLTAEVAELKAELKDVIKRKDATLKAVVCEASKIIYCKEAETKKIIQVKDVEINNLDKKLYAALQEAQAERIHRTNLITLETAKLNSKATTQKNILESQKVQTNLLESAVDAQKKAMAHMADAP